MPDTNKYDVIIAGGGPAGSTAGYLLSKSGLKVLLLDKNVFPRHKLCAGCITDKTIKLLERVFGETIEDLKKKEIINFESSHYEVFCRDKLVTKKDSPVPFYFVERPAYDNYFLRKAQEAGVNVMEGDGAASFDIFRNEVQTSSGRTFTAGIMIGADGINSVIRRQFPSELFDHKAWRYNLATGLEMHVNREDVQKTINHPALYFDYINHGYAWVFPNKNNLIVGIGGLASKNKKQFLPLFHNFLSELGIEDPQKYSPKGYTFPYGNYLLKPVFRNTILIGDAAGFADPLLGEGIYYAQRSAELASLAICEAVKEGKAIEIYAANRYLHSLQEDIYREFVYAKKTRDFIFGYLSKSHHLLFKIMMEMFGVKPLEAIHGIRSYKWFKRRH